MSIVVGSWPFRVAALAWHPRRGYLGVTVVAKVTYRLRSGASPFAERAEELLPADVASPNDSRRIWKPADCAPFKGPAEVIVVADGARAGVSGVPRIVVAGIDKTATSSDALCAFGAVRHCDAGGTCRSVDAWDERALRELPALDGVDTQRFNVAPADQRLLTLPVEVDLDLTNVISGTDRLVTRLDPMKPRVFVSFDGGAAAELAARCDTLVIEADRGIACLLWRAFSWVAPGASPRFAVQPDRALPARAAAPHAEVSIDTTAEMPSVARDDDPLPFVEHGGGLTKGSPQPQIVTVPRVIPGGSIDETAQVAALGHFELALPFDKPRPVDSFEAGPPPQSTAPPWTEPPEWSKPAAAQVVAAIDAYPTAAAPAPPEPETALSLPVDRDVLVARFSLEQCAALAAELACRPVDRADVLARNQMAEEHWEVLHAHYEAEARAEAKRGKNERMRRFDDAYVAELARLRRAVTADDYARLAIAAERGEESAVLAELDLPAQAWPHLRRSWLTRIVADPRLGKKVREAVSRAREA